MDEKALKTLEDQQKIILPAFIERMKKMSHTEIMEELTTAYLDSFQGMFHQLGRDFNKEFKLGVEIGLHFFVSYVIKKITIIRDIEREDKNLEPNLEKILITTKQFLKKAFESVEKGTLKRIKEIYEE